MARSLSKRGERDVTRQCAGRYHVCVAHVEERARDLSAGLREPCETSGGSSAPLFTTVVHGIAPERHHRGNVLSTLGASDDRPDNATSSAIWGRDQIRSIRARR